MLKIEDDGVPLNFVKVMTALRPLKEKTKDQFSWNEWVPTVDEFCNSFFFFLAYNHITVECLIKILRKGCNTT